MITTNPWVKIICRPAVRLRLFCFPYAGAGALAFRTWQGKFPSEVEVCPVQLPGRENRFREAPFTDIPALTHAIAEALLPYLDLPFLFYGHSLGALVAFETVRSLRARVVPQPVQLLVSGYRAPQMPRSAATIYQLPDAQFLREVANLGGISNEILQNTNLVQLILPTLRADITLFDTYTYVAAPALECPIFAYGGLQDARATQSEMEHWHVQTSTKFALQMFPGGHFFLQTAQDQFLSALLQTILSSL